jgi:hypothetical protein
MSDSEFGEERASDHSRRRWPLVLLCVAILGALFFGVFLYLDHVSQEELSALQAATDQGDPEWSLTELEAKRAIVPDRANSAFPAIAAKKLLPKSWPYWWDRSPNRDNPQAATEEEIVALQEGFDSLTPPEQMNQEEITALRQEMQRAAPALAEARKIIALTRGRYPITYSSDFISTLIPHTQDARAIANLLALDAQLLAQDKDIDGALASCRGVVNAGRSVGDEPLMISMLVRVALDFVALEKVQRTLAQGEASEAALAQLQALLEKEVAEPLLLNAARGERAGAERLMQALENGDISLEQLEGMAGNGRNGGAAGVPILDDIVMRIRGGSLKANRIALLKMNNQFVELARLPVEEQHAPLQEWEIACRGDLPPIARMLLPAFVKVAGSYHRAQACLRCGIALVAAERFRLAQGRWPKTLTELVPTYLRKVPIDPYDKAPLRWVRFADGYTVYSVGQDGQDNGGIVTERSPVKPGVDVGYRLWDVSKRRQPAQPLKKPEPGFPAPFPAPPMPRKDANPKR